MDKEDAKLVDLDRFLGFCDGNLLVSNSVSIKYVEIPDEHFKPYMTEQTAKSASSLSFMT
jgi:hypothetical protein